MYRYSRWTVLIISVGGPNAVSCRARAGNWNVARSAILKYALCEFQGAYRWLYWLCDDLRTLCYVRYPTYATLRKQLYLSNSTYATLHDLRYLTGSVSVLKRCEMWDDIVKCEMTLLSVRWRCGMWLTFTGSLDVILSSRTPSTRPLVCKDKVLITRALPRVLITRLRSRAARVTVTRQTFTEWY